MSVHADPPPATGIEPFGTNYATANQLGKGGFAICFKAERHDGDKPTGHMVALKIVKSKMEPAKLAQKVWFLEDICLCCLLTPWPVHHRTPNTLEAVSSQYCYLPPRFLLRTEYLRCPGVVFERISGRLTKETEMCYHARDQTFHDPSVWCCQISSRPQHRPSRLENR